MKTLVVEDAKVMRMALESSLKESDDIDELRVAEFVAEARQICRSFVPDLAVLDVLLPDGNGIELIGNIKAVNHNARIVMLSHYAEIHQAQALRAGADIFIDKSHGLAHVLESLSSVVSDMAKAWNGKCPPAPSPK